MAQSIQINKKWSIQGNKVFIQSKDELNNINKLNNNKYKYVCCYSDKQIEKVIGILASKELAVFAEDESFIYEPDDIISDEKIYNIQRELDNGFELSETLVHELMSHIEAGGKELPKDIIKSMNKWLNEYDKREEIDMEISELKVENKRLKTELKKALKKSNSQIKIIKSFILGTCATTIVIIVGGIVLIANNPRIINTVFMIMNNGGK